MRILFPLLIGSTTASIQLADPTTTTTICQTIAGMIPRLTKRLVVLDGLVAKSPVPFEGIKWDIYAILTMMDFESAPLSAMTAPGGFCDTAYAQRIVARMLRVFTDLQVSSSAAQMTGDSHDSPLPRLVKASADTVKAEWEALLSSGAVVDRRIPYGSPEWLAVIQLVRDTVAEYRATRHAMAVWTTARVSTKAHFPLPVVLAIRSLSELTDTAEIDADLVETLEAEGMAGSERARSMMTTLLDGAGANAHDFEESFADLLTACAVTDAGQRARELAAALTPRHTEWRRLVLRSQQVVMIVLIQWEIGSTTTTQSPEVPISTKIRNRAARRGAATTGEPTTEITTTPSTTTPLPSTSTISTTAAPSSTASSTSSTTTGGIQPLIFEFNWADEVDAEEERRALQTSWAMSTTTPPTTTTATTGPTPRALVNPWIARRTNTTLAMTPTAPASETQWSTTTTTPQTTSITTTTPKTVVYPWTARKQHTTMIISTSTTTTTEPEWSTLRIKRK